MAKLFILFLLALALVAASNSKVSRATAEEDADLQQRRQYMAQVIRFGASPELAAAADAETTHRLAMFLKREMGPIEAIFHAIRRMPESSAEAARTKEDAFDAAMDLLARHLRLLLPHGCAACRDKTVDDAGFTVSDMPPENSTADAAGFAIVRRIPSKEETRAKVKELMHRHLDQQLLHGGSVKVDDDQSHASMLAGVKSLHHRLIVL